MRKDFSRLGRQPAHTRFLEEATMRRSTTTLRGAGFALVMLACMAGAASAQMIFDGNIVYQNNASGTLAGQFIGTPPGPGAGCPAGTSSATLGTVTYTHNTYQDPLLTNGLYHPGVIPNFQPSAGSP